MRNSRRTYAANPSTETGGNTEKRNNVLTEIYKFFCNTPSLPEKAFISHMLPIADSSFLHPAHMVSQKQVQVECGSIDALDVSIMNSRVPSASIDECLH